jgi:flavin reductase (DIM6/NTAB) family NADH-FMN oxidoreductase RutF
VTAADHHDTDARFDDLMGRLDHAMAIVTTAAGDVRSGCLVGFHSQCGIDPPRLAIWLSKGNHTYRVGVLCETFAVHFPTAGQHDLARLFGADTGDDVDKFVHCAWTRGPDDVPLIDACPTRFVGRRVALVDAGADHVCLVLAPVQVDEPDGPDEPDPDGWLMFHDVVGLTAGHPPTDRQHPG